MLFWIGLSVLLLVLQTIHLVRPIGPAITYPILALGFAGFALDLRAGGTARWSRIARYCWLWVPAGVWVAVQATAGPEIYDDGLYHFQAVQWLNKYSIVPGLGNLDGRLGFNQSYFLYYAFLNVPPLVDRAYHFANGLLTVVLLCQMLRSLHQVATQRMGASAAALFQTLLLPMIVREISPLLQYRGRAISSPSPDLPITILGVVLMTEFIALACPASASTGSRMPRFLMVVVVSAAAITVKLSFAVMGTLFLAGAVLLAWRDGLPLRSRPAAVAATLASAMMLIWMARGILTNGYPLYPSTALGVGVDWKIPVENVRAMADSIKGFARLPTTEWQHALTGFEWLPAWWARNAKGGSMVPLLWAAAGIGILFPLCRRFGRTRFDLPLWRLLLPAAPLVSSLAFWFLAAPDPRFWGATPSCLVGWLGVLCLLHGPPSFATKILPAGIVLVASLIAFPVSQSKREQKRDVLGWVSVPKGTVGEFVTRSGLHVFVRTSDGLPWNRELPVTAYPDPGLVLRSKRQRDGFRVEKGSPGEPPPTETTPAVPPTLELQIP